MQTQKTLEYDEILSHAYLLSKNDKKKLIEDLKADLSEKKERKFGKYDGMGWISDDFDEPIDDFNLPTH
jgi:hypothetical protein